MSTTETQLQPGQRISMSWEDYDGLNVEGHGEYIDGEYVHMNAPTGRHQDILFNLARLIDEILPAGVQIRLDWAWKPTDDQFVPDAIVFDRTEEDLRLTQTPHLAVEVLSSDSAADTIRKHRKYAEAALPRYWIIDPAGPEITVYHLQEGQLVEIARHVAGSKATLDIGPVTVTLDPADLVKDS